MSKTDEAMTDQDLFNEMRSVAFNRDFEKEIKVFVGALENMEQLGDGKVFTDIKDTFKELFLVR